MFRSRVRTGAPVRDAHIVPNPGGRSTLELLMERAAERAHEEGVREGAARERAALGPRIEEVVSRLEAAEAEAREELPRAAVRIATTIARTLLKRDLAQGEYDIEGMVRESLAEANVGRGTCTVHLHPTDYAQLAETPFRAGTTIRADEGVAKGDVHVETSLGLLVREALGAIPAIERRLLEDLA